MSSFALPYAPSETLGLIPERLERLTAVMAREVEEKKAPGVSMLIARHGKIAYRELVGALRPGGPPMTEDAIFRIYSMTKPIVSVAAMMLVEEGRLLDHGSRLEIPPRLREPEGRRRQRRQARPCAAQAADHRPGPHAAYVGADLRLHRRVASPEAGQGGRRREIRTGRWPKTSRRSRRFRSCISRARSGSTACRPTCSVALSRSSKALRSARSCSIACSARSAWSTPPSSRRNRNSPGAPIRSRSTS